jgi:hypothetical protein
MTSKVSNVHIPILLAVTQLALPSLVTSRLLRSIQHCCFLSYLYQCWLGIEKTPGYQYDY